MFGVALGVRLLHAVYVSRLPFFEGPVIDAMVNRAFAHRFAELGELGGPFYQPPLYPLFLGLLERVGLGSAWNVAIVQSVLGSATSALLVLVAPSLVSSSEERARWVGLGSGLAAALYGPFVLFDLELLPPSVVLLAFTVAALLALRRGRSRRSDVLAGLCLGAAVTGWPLVVVALGALVFGRARRAGTGRERWIAVGAIALGALPPVLLVAAHNARSGAPGIVISYNSGINLWLGNNPAFRDTWRARPGAAFEPEFERPDREGKTTPLARTEYFTRAVVRDALARPGAFVARTLEKAYYVWHGREIRRNQDIETLRRASPVLRALLWEHGLLFPFGLVAPLALAGLVRKRRDPESAAVLVAVAAYGAILALYFVAARYRLPLVILLLPHAIEEALRLGRREASRGELAGILGLAVAVNAPNDFTKTFEATDAERGILLAQAYRNQGNAERAAAIAGELAAAHPDDANVQMLRSETLIAAGRCADALRPLQRTTELSPVASTPWVLLGACHADLGDPAAAERAFATALSLHPFHPAALKRAGILYASHGRFLEARVLLERFARAGYTDPEVTAWQGRVDAAMRTDGASRAGASR